MSVFKNVMQRFDLNDDAKVPKKEFKQALEEEGVPSDTIKEMMVHVFRNWDDNADEVLGKKEIESLAEKWSEFN